MPLLVPMLWQGKPLIRNGVPALGQACCCESGTGPCSRCDPGTTPAVVGLYLHSGAMWQELPGCDCTAFEGVWWDMPQLTQDEIDEVWALNTSAIAEEPPGSGLCPGPGCVYGINTGLPCDVIWMVGEVRLNGETGIASFSVCVIWDIGGVLKWDRYGFALVIDPPSGDCRANLDTSAHTQTASGMDTFGPPPCSFVGLLLDPTLFELRNSG